MPPIPRDQTRWLVVDLGGQYSRPLPAYTRIHSPAIESWWWYDHQRKQYRCACYDPWRFRLSHFEGTSAEITYIPAWKNLMLTNRVTVCPSPPERDDQQRLRRQRHLFVLYTPRWCPHWASGEPTEGLPSPSRWHSGAFCGCHCLSNKWETRLVGRKVL